MQVEYKTEKGNLLFVKVPDKFSHPFMTKGYTEAVLWPEFGNNVEIELSNDEHGQIDLPGVGWQLIGLTSEITEEQCYDMGYEGEIEILEWPANTDKPIVKEHSPLDQFKLEMQVNKVYEFNPYSDDDGYEFLGYGDDMHIKFIEAQSRTGKWVVLFKQNE